MALATGCCDDPHIGPLLRERAPVPTPTRTFGTQPCRPSPAGWCDDDTTSVPREHATTDDQLTNLMLDIYLPYTDRELLDATLRAGLSG